MKWFLIANSVHWNILNFCNIFFFYLYKKNKNSFLADPHILVIQNVIHHDRQFPQYLTGVDVGGHMLILLTVVMASFFLHFSFH